MAPASSNAHSALQNKGCRILARNCSDRAPEPLRQKNGPRRGMRMNGFIVTGFRCRPVTSFTTCYRSRKNYQYSTQGQKHHQNSAPVLVIISGNSLVLSTKKNITSTVFTGAAPQRVSTSSGNKFVSHVKLLAHFNPCSARNLEPQFGKHGLQTLRRTVTNAALANAALVLSSKNRKKKVSEMGGSVEK